MSLLDTLRDGAEHPSSVDGPPAFRFDEEGQEIFGKVHRVSFSVQTKYGDVDVVEVEDHERGLVTLWLSQVQLVNGLVRGSNPLGRPIAEGDVVYIRFDGTKSLDGGKTLKQFSLNLAAGDGSIPESF